MNEGAPVEHSANRSIRAWPLFLIVSFACALLWARAKDPFERVHFSFKSATHETARAQAVLAKPVSARPVILCLYDARDAFQNKVLRLRQFAELGLAAVSIDYNVTNQAAFDDQFAALLANLPAHSWARSNSLAWLGCGIGAQRLVSFATRHPASQPQLLIALAGSVDTQIPISQPALRSRVLLVHGRADEVLSAWACEQQAAFLRQLGATVDLALLDNQSHDFGLDRDVVYHAIAEYAAAFFALPGARSTQAEQSFWHYGIPVLAITGWLSWRAVRKTLAACLPPGTKFTKPARALNLVAGCLATAALLQTGLRLALPLAPVSVSSAWLACRLLLQPELRKDFVSMALNPDWNGKPMRALLQHVELANLQRRQFYRALGRATYRKYVLSPDLGPGTPQEWGWRRQLWTSFFPRVRKEDNPVGAARIVARFLRERVGINPTLTHRAGVETTWSLGQTDLAGFNEIYVAALRSVGIAARLNAQGHAELWAKNQWQPAPEPLVRAGFAFEPMPASSPGH